MERQLISGNRHRHASSIIPPEFERYLAQELKEEAEKQKNARKLREEQAAEAKRLAEMKPK